MAITTVENDCKPNNKKNDVLLNKSPQVRANGVLRICYVHKLCCCMQLPLLFMCSMHGPGGLPILFPGGKGHC